MFNVSICEYFPVLNVFIVCICNTAVFKLIPILCTHVYSYMFSTVHPPRVSLMKRNLHEINLNPSSSLIKQNVVSYTCCIAWYFFNDWFPTLIRPYFYIEFFKKEPCNKHYIPCILLHVISK